MEVGSQLESAKRKIVVVSGNINFFYMYVYGLWQKLDKQIKLSRFCPFFQNVFAMIINGSKTSVRTDTRMKGLYNDSPNT